MRILALRGANLASLSEFDIDLTAEPLASAGLFAITGDTGAGKSTILDAMCLALFGEYPRAAVGRAERVADPSGDLHTIQDSRNILRRGAATGFAEVDFIGADGIAYRARWEARRAKGKADGKLQKEFRRLDRLDGAGAVATGTRDVLAAVEQRTGLTFDQFRRTVLLAQGEFDAFLLADEKARAELLEKITGTDIYRRISQAANAATGEKAAEIAKLQARAGSLDVLTAEQRSALEAQLATCDETIREKQAARDALAGELAAARRQAEAKRQLAAADAALAAARAAEAAAQPDRDRLALADRLAPLDDKAAAVRSAEASVAAAEAAHVDAEKAAQAAAQAAMAAAVALQRAIQADVAADAELASKATLWREADALDRDIDGARKALDERRQAAAKAAGDARRASDAVTKLATEIEAGRTERQGLAAGFQPTGVLASYAERAGDLDALLDKRARLAAARTAALDEARRGAQDVHKLAEQAKGDLELATRLKARQADLSTQLERLRLELKQHDSTSVDSRARSLADLCVQLAEVCEIAEAWNEAGEEIAAARQTVEQASAVLVRAEAQRQTAEVDLDRKSIARREVSRLADLAEATASEAAAGLRAALLPGQPCPVCGGSDHPYGQHSDSSQRVVAGILARREALDRDLSALTDTLTTARGDAAAAKAEHDDAARRIEETEHDRQRLVELYAAARPSLNEALASPEAPEAIPAELTSETAAALRLLRDEVAAARETVEDSLSRITELRQAVDSLQAEADDVAAEREVVAQRAEQMSARHQTAESFRAITEGKVQQSNSALAVVTLALAPYLDAASLSILDLDRDPSAARARFVELAGSHTRLKDRLAALDRHLQQLAVDEAAAKAQLAAATEAASQASRGVSQYDASLAELVSKRAALLGGEATDTHRTSLEAARKAKADARAAADEAQRTGALEHVRHIERTLAARAAVDAAVTARDNARETFAKALAAAGIADPRALEVVRMSPEAIDALRAATTALGVAVAESSAARDMRHSDLAAALADGAIERSETDLTAAIGLSDQAMVAARDAAAAARARLGLDDEARRRAGAIAAEIEVAKEDHAVWKAVDDAIGSASGDKFRRFAQAITLDHLVRLANIQLDMINPRYQLARSSGGDLALAVIDRDMGDDVRGVRSLSGGERFLVSLALALALSGLEGRQQLVDTLFIDEGFGSLDAETLDMALNALEALHSHGRKVGVVTHVAGMIERIAVQIRVDKRGHGRSVVRLVDAHALPLAS